MTMATTTKTTKTTKKAATKKAAKKTKGMSASAARAEGAARTKRALAASKGAAPEAADKAATAPAEAKAPTTAPKAPGATRAKDGAKGGKRAKAPTAAPKVEVLTEDEARKRGGMTEIIRTLKGRDAAVRQAANAGGFVIEHEDGRYSAAKTAEPAAATDQPAEAPVPEQPAKKYDMATAPGKALDHIVKETKRLAKAKAKAAEKPAVAKGTKQPTAAKERKPKRMSALDAAAQVLAKAKQPVRAKELIQQMAAEGLWESPGGKTPEATLYAAMLREISKKGDESRFRKVDRGAFAAAGKGAA
jgi:hypothetical protein